jgi:NADH:ubiquinone oxidoreductase subunit 3 (subunit A)
MSDLVFHLVLFTVAGVTMVAVPLLIGKLLRPKLPNPEKDAVYECGEPTIGSSFIQFDLRFYTVALLFIVFDVEVAFFFPWTAMYGNTMQLTDTDMTPDARIEISEKLLNISSKHPFLNGKPIANIDKAKSKLQRIVDGGEQTAAQAIAELINSQNDEFWLQAERKITRAVVLRQIGADGESTPLSPDEVDAALDKIDGSISVQLRVKDKDFAQESPELAALLGFKNTDAAGLKPNLKLAMKSGLSDEFHLLKQDALLSAVADEMGVPKDEIAKRFISAADARSMGWLAFADIAVFFGVLLVGFAYVWKRGDLEWVRAVDS